MRIRLPSLAVALLAASLAVPPAAFPAEGYGVPGGGAAAAPTNQYVIITAPETEILAAPEEGAAVLGKAARRTVLPLKGELPDWYQVATGDTETGWVHRGVAAQIYYPEFLDPEGLAESWENSAPVYIPPGAYRYPPDWWTPYGSWLPLWRDPYPWSYPGEYWGQPLWRGFPGYGYDRRWDGDHRYSRGQHRGYYPGGPYGRRPYYRDWR